MFKYINFLFPYYSEVTPDAFAFANTGITQAIGVIAFGNYFMIYRLLNYFKIKMRFFVAFELHLM